VHISLSSQNKLQYLREHSQGFTLMPELLTPPTARPTVVTIETARFISKETVIAADQVLFGTALPQQEFASSNLNGSMAVYIDYDVYSGLDPHGLTNHGIINLLDFYAFTLIGKLVLLVFAPRNNDDRCWLCQKNNGYNLDVYGLLGTDSLRD
jgi:hypothetical protein